MEQPARRPPRQPHVRRRSVRITNRDLELLAFVADHRLVLPGHVQALLGVSATATYSRLRALSGAGMLEVRPLFHRQPACYQITRKGLELIDSRLPPPKLDLRGYEHDVGLAWVCLGARAGTFGGVREIISERQLRSRDGFAEPGADPLAVRLGGYGPGGRERLHYPDLVLLTASGHRVAVELELSSKARTRRETILSGYAADARVDAVLYLVERRGVGREIRASAARLGIPKLVHVQQVALSAATRSSSEGSLRTASRNAEAAAR